MCFDVAPIHAQKSIVVGEVSELIPDVCGGGLYILTSLLRRLNAANGFPLALDCMSSACNDEVIVLAGCTEGPQWKESECWVYSRNDTDLTLYTMNYADHDHDLQANCIRCVSKPKARFLGTFSDEV